jgi:hypothetical protein
MKTISHKSLTRIAALTVTGLLLTTATARAAGIKLVTSGAFTAAYLQLVRESGQRPDSHRVAIWPSGSPLANILLTI